MKSFLLIILFVLLTSSNTTPSLTEVMDYISSVNNIRVKTKKIKVWALENNYEHELIPSVSLYLFEDIEMNENIAPVGNPNRPGDKHEKRYITVHDTGDFSFNAGEWSKHVHDAKIGNSIYNASFQYVVGNDGYYHNIPDDETAYHAGDGRDSTSLFKEFATEVYGDKKNPNISISTDGYYTIEGKKTKILAPTDNEGNILDESYFNDMGIYTTIKDGMYYIGSTWYSETYNKIGNYGGNFNSIGIESCVNKGSDIYLTWQRLAKLVAKLMDDNNFTMRQIVQHHYYSGKDCPQTMRTEGYWNHFMNLVEVEYQMLQYKKMGFSFELTPLNSKYVNNIGRVIDRGFYLPLNANFVVKVTDSKGNSLSEVFSFSIPPKNL
jgi:N-acetylmuramoyl-L-alanine amidase CwlA